MSAVPRAPRSESSLLCALGADTRGVVHAEYVIVLALVAVGIVTAMAAAGVLLLNLYLYQEQLILLPVP